MPFWLAPSFAIVLMPLYLHAAVQNSDRFADGEIFAFFGLFLTIFSFSILGCIASTTCDCPSNFPLVVSAVQLVFTMVFIIVMMSWYSPSRTLASDQMLPDQAVSDMYLPDVPASPPAASAVTQHRTALPAQDPRSKMLAEDTPVIRLPVQKSELLPGWTDVGDGYCEDSDSHQEFSSLHANGKTLQECKDTATADKYSIAIDFSAKDGGCDIRYPAGFLAQDTPGYEWWGWGAGEGKPAGFGKTKHDTETHCFAKVIVPTVAPPPGEHNEAAYPLTTKLHPYARAMARTYCFRNVKNERDQLVNVMLVRAPWQSRHEEELFDKYKKEILFIGISSLEDYPLPGPNPFSPNFPRDKYVGLFPGFLNMYRNPEKIYPSHVKTLLMSQSDFSLPPMQPALPKIYDFTFSGTDQDVDNDCVGWSSFAKNWTFVVEALEVMCGELGMTGVLVATMAKQGEKKCKIPSSCEGKMKQTRYLENQQDFFHYVRQSRFVLAPQVHDASPRVVAQALALNVPLLMNRNLIGGWKYLTEKTGEFFNDITDFRQSVKRLLHNIEAGDVYEPRKFMDENYGDDNAGARFAKFISENFQDRVKLPEGTTRLYPVGA